MNMRCTGDGCSKRIGCPYFNSTAKLEFDPPDDECDLYYQSADSKITCNLTLEQQSEIRDKLALYRDLKRQMKEVSCTALAKRYKVSADTIYRIRRACRL